MVSANAASFRKKMFEDATTFDFVQAENARFLKKLCRNEIGRRKERT
jgi:hypothetical protein